MQCPVCKTQITEEIQEYCDTCAWEFEYFLGELEEIELNKYYKRLKIAKNVYEKSMLEPKFIDIERTIEKPKVDKFIGEKQKLSNNKTRNIIEISEDHNKRKRKGILTILLQTLVITFIVLTIVYYINYIEGIETDIYIIIYILVVFFPISVWFNRAELLDRSRSIIVINDLMWEISLKPLRYDWELAMDQSKIRLTMGYDDWRLPTKKELLRLSRNELVSHLKPDEGYWTSDTDYVFDNSGWVIKFCNGSANASHDAKYRINNVIYVRNM